MTMLAADASAELSMVAMLGIAELDHRPPALDRSVSRRIALQVLFELDCTSHPAGIVISYRVTAQEASREQEREIRWLVTQVLQNRSTLDEMIETHAIDWPLENLAIVDRNILRMAILELAIARKAPVAVIVNEAIELARLFSGEESFNFIHGILGAIDAENRETSGNASREKVREASVEEDQDGVTSDPEAQQHRRGPHDKAVFRLIQNIAYSGKDLLERDPGVQELPRSVLPGQAISAAHDPEHDILTAVHEWHGERASGLFPEATHIVLATGEAKGLLERVANEFLPDGSISLDEDRRACWREALAELEKQGDRVLAIAWQPLQELPGETTGMPPDKDRDIPTIAAAGAEIPLP